MPRHALRARLKGPRRKLESKVALVTGSGCGIGRAIALKLAREGAWIVVNDRDAESTNVVLAERKAAGAQAISVIGPVNDDGFAARFVGAAMEQFGTIDIVVNNAGYTWDASIQKATDEQFQTMLDVHVMAPFRILRAAAEPIRLAAKKDAAEGREVFRKVVNISSVAGLFSNPGQVSYASAKASLIGMTKTLSKEWERYKVNVNCVAFGLINTRLTQPIEAGKSLIEIDGREIAVGIQPATRETFEKMIPIDRAGTLEEAADAVYLLCSPESNYISGQVLVCGGGLAL